mgnify:CR=1 FL=1
MILKMIPTKVMTTKIITIKTITPQIPVQLIKVLQQEPLQQIKVQQVQLLQQIKELQVQAQEQQEVNLPEQLLQAAMQKLVTRQVSGDGLVLQ